MKQKLNKVARETNLYLKSYIKKQKKSNLIEPIKYGLFSGGKICCNPPASTEMVYNLNSNAV